MKKPDKKALARIRKDFVYDVSDCLYAMLDTHYFLLLFDRAGIKQPRTCWEYEYDSLLSRYCRELGNHPELVQRKKWSAFQRAVFEVKTADAAFRHIAMEYFKQVFHKEGVVAPVLLPNDQDEFWTKMNKIARELLHIPPKWSEKTR